MADFHACPCCRAPLFAARAPDVTMLCCKQCGGIWLDNAGSRMAAEALLSGYAQQVARSLDEIRPGVRKQPLAPYRVQAVPEASKRLCPICSKELSRAWVQVSRSELDICVVHGTFFDRHELWGLIQAVSDESLAAESDPKKQLREMMELQREAGGSGWSVHGLGHRDRDVASLVIDAILDFE